jgi:hypothetical protein
VCVQLARDDVVKVWRGRRLVHLRPHCISILVDADCVAHDVVRLRYITWAASIPLRIRSLAVAAGRAADEL